MNREVHIMCGSTFAIKGYPDITPQEEKDGRMIGAGAYIEEYWDDGQFVAGTWDMYVVPDEYL